MADNRNWAGTISSLRPIKKSEATYMVSGRLPSSSIRTVTVGSGISPDQPPKRVADYTAGGELHPALKIKYLPWYQGFATCYKES